jgi:hypothetical protein
MVSQNHSMILRFINFKEVGMKRICAVIFFIVCIALSNHANPVIPPAITEVFINSPTQWYIELDAWSISPIQVSCTTTAFQLKISSIGQVFPIKCYVNKDGIAVLTRASIVGIPDSQTVAIANYDTINIKNTSQTGFTWKFPVRPVGKGNSLYITSYNGDPIETDRTTIGISGNPPSAYLLPFIREVHVPDSIHWAMELDSKYSGLPFTIAAPCTVSRFRMKVTNSPAINSVKAIFDTAGIAVLRPGDIFVGSNIYTTIAFPTTLRVLDSAWNDSLLSGLCWKFDIAQPVDSGHSLINGGTYTTMRKGIGKRIDYVTRYEIHTRNSSDHSPVSGLYIYGEELTDMSGIFGGSKFYAECLNFYGSQADSFCILSARLGAGSQWFGFSREKNSLGLCPQRSQISGTSYTIKYIDSLEAIVDTVLIPPPTFITQKIKKSLNQNILFSAIHRGHKRLLFTLALNHAASSAQVRLFSLKGALTALADFGHIASAGTYSCEWANGKPVSTGMYLCKLYLDGVEVKSLKVKVW